ncbi:MAG: TetR/AcrR family transcriptional regulator, partial [Bacteroidales bacterium]|nr:TetR/AcrR family transcriptional regulator [Bacteroidales bacterium]
MNTSHIMSVTERKKREKQLRRNAIIDAAEQLFFKQGFDNVSMDQIAREADLAKGTLYLYFKSREDLHYSIVNRALEMIYKVLKDQYDPEKKGAENLLKLGKSYIDFSQNYPNHIRAIMMFDSSKFEKLDKNQSLKILEPDSPLVFFTEIIKKGQLDGSIRSDIRDREMALILWSHLSSILELVT